MSQNTSSTSIPAFLLASVIAGCAGTRDRAPVWTPQPREDATLSQWKEVYTIALVSGENRRIHRGYLEHRFSPTSEEATRYIVYDDNLEPVGFWLPNGKAYAYGPDVSGEMTVRRIGHDELDDAVLKLLEADGSIEYGDITPGNREKPESTTSRGERSPAG